MAFPYVATSNGEETVQNALVTEFSEKCGQGFGESIVINDIDKVQVFTNNSLAHFISICI